MRNGVCHSHPASDTVLEDAYIGRLVVPRTNDGACTDKVSVVGTLD